MVCAKKDLPVPRMLIVLGAASVIRRMDIVSNVACPVNVLGFRFVEMKGFALTGLAAQPIHRVQETWFVDWRNVGRLSVN